MAQVKKVMNQLKTGMRKLNVFAMFDFNGVVTRDTFAGMMD